MRLLVLKQSILITIFLLSPLLYAKDLGVIGQTYPIQEMDFLEFIHQRLQILQQSGNLKKLNSQWIENVKNHADRPLSLGYISKTLTPRSWNMTPAITVPFDLRDHQGRIFAKAGTVINPLQWVSIHKPMLFFDGDDKDEVLWAKELNKKLNNQTKLVLVKGSISQQTKAFQQPIYFDQAGRLISRFHIQHVPAIVEQEGLNLKISEVLP